MLGVTYFFDQLLNGLMLGSMYALLAAGIALVYGTMHILNFAHGDFFMIGAYIIFLFGVTLSLPPVLAIVLTVLLVAVVSGLFQRATIYHLLKRDGVQFSTMALTLGLGIFLQNLALLIFGHRFRMVPYYAEGIVGIGELRIPVMRILIFGSSVVVLTILSLVMKFTRFGQAVRATSQDRDAALVMGIPAHRIQTLTFMIGTGLSGFAATMLAPIYTVTPWMGVPYMLKAMAIVILGGLGSYSGAIVAGFLVGIVESLGMGYTNAEWRDVFSFALLFLVVWFRPWGLFGSKGGQR